MELDGLTNDALENEAKFGSLPGATIDFTREQIIAEQERVNVVVEANALTGVDLGYWFERDIILDELLEAKDGGH